MKFSDQYQYEVNTDLRELEQVLKELWLKNQERSLDKPHDLDATATATAMIIIATILSAAKSPTIFVGNSFKRI